MRMWRELATSTSATFRTPSCSNLTRLWRDSVTYCCLSCAYHFSTDVMTVRILFLIAAICTGYTTRKFAVLRRSRRRSHLKFARCQFPCFSNPHDPARSESARDRSLLEDWLLIACYQTGIRAAGGKAGDFPGSTFRFLHFSFFL